MATPTPGKQPAVATPPVSTPFSTSNHHSVPAFSPHGPRSVVPSPQQVKKSPANSNTMYGYPGGGHPTNSSFGGVGFDSPSAAMALGNGLDITALDGMGVGGGIGGGMMAPPKTDEDERRRKLEVVKDKLKESKGRLSEAGIERLAQRMGLDCIWESTLASGGNAGRTLIIAGSALALDIDFANNVVKKVSLSFPESPESVTRHSDKAGNILLRDLSLGEGQSPLTKTLDRFAGNLQRLATLDKLSVIPGLNCHEAIAGVYESLERLHRWEVNALRGGEMKGSNADLVARAALCTRSGKPVMHTRDRLGMSLDYWQEKRRIRGSKDAKSWSLMIECARLPPLMFGMSLKVSENWISPEIQQPNPPAEELLLAPASSPVLDWREPEATLLPTDIPTTDAMTGVDHSAQQKLPEVMFLAVFDPPLIVPWTIWNEVHNVTNVPLPDDDNLDTSTLDGLMFPNHSSDDSADNVSREYVRERSVPVFSRSGEKSLRSHKNRLYINKAEYARTLREIPFSHPRQLVAMLPTLRQYVFISTVLGNSFGDKSRPVAKEMDTMVKINKKAAFAEFMKGSGDGSLAQESQKKVDVVFTTNPTPKLDVVFPFKGKTGNVSFEIRANGEAVVLDQNVIAEDRSEATEVGDGKMKLKKADLGRMLEITEDLGIWVEFVLRRLG